MKNLKNKFLAALFAVAFIGLTSTGSAQVTSINLNFFTNFPATLATSAASTVTNIYPVGKNSSLAIQVPFVSAAGNTAPVSVSGCFTIDGTNYGTTPFTLTGNANGTNLVVLQTNFTTFQLAGYSGINVYLWTNGATAAITNRGIGMNRTYYNY